MSFNRRDFLKFIGGSTMAAATLNTVPGLLLSSQAAEKKLFPVVSPSAEDLVKLAEGLEYKVLISWGDKINKNEEFGFNNDYTAMIPLQGKKDEGILWVNHEAVNPIMLGTMKRTKADIDKERKAVGGSLLHLKKNKQGDWEVVKDSQYNRRVSGETEIPFAAGIKIKGKASAVGTLGNCAGGVTPWGTILTCEENYHDFYGEVDFRTQKKKEVKGYNLRWDQHYDLPPEHYGWVVEVNPLTGKAKKHTSIGRFAHECATVITAKNGKPVVYSGDDKAGEFIYKFVSDKEGSLETGELFVADIKNGKWLSLDRNKNKKLKETFKDQLEVHINCRLAGRLVGATPMDRPEDFEIDPKSGAIFVCLTNNKKAENYHGSILKIEESNGDYLSQTFKASDFAIGGKGSGFSCPDNLVFDKRGNLWMSTDISGSAMNKEPYTEFKNNGVFYFPMSGPHAGIAHQVASAPVDAEFTGLSFDPAGKKLFISVQHPGEKSKSLGDLTSHWPDGGSAMPKPSVIQVSGPLLDKLMRS